MLWINVAVILSYIPSIVQGKGLVIRATKSLQPATKSDFNSYIIINGLKDFYGLGYGYLIDRDLIAKKDGFKFNLHSGSGVVRGKAFHSLGCWKDTWIRAIQPLEKRHVLLMNGNYKLRDDPLRKCAIAALDNKMKLFAIENGGQCLGETTITSSYKKYGATNHCKDDGYGGPWSMQVYGFTRAKLRRHGGYSKWSSWTKCVGTCGKGIEKRFRTCSHPSPAHGGRDCSRLGPGMETRPCASECLGTEDDDLEDSSKSDNSKDKTKASKKSDDTDDYLDDDDDDDDLDDDDDKSSNNFENKPNKINGGKNKNQADDSESNPSYKSAEKDVFKNSYAKISKPLDHFAQYQGTNIGGNSNAKFSKSAHMVGNDLDKTQSGSPVLKSTSDMIKSDGEMTNDSPPLSQSSTVGENSKNIAFGNKAGDSDSNSALANGLSGTSGAAGTIKQPTLNQGGKPKENNDQSTGAANGSTVKNHLSDISNTQTSDASMKVTSTTESELGNSEEKHDENASDEDLSESKSTMENNMSDSSKTSSNVHDVKGSTQDTTDTKPDNTGEKVDEGLSNDEDKSTMDNDASDVSNSESSDNGAHMKEVNQSAEKTQPDAMVESDGSSSFDAQNNPPITKQMKAAQDLLRSRWLSLAKSGNLKPTPLKQSTKVSENPSKPVVDVSLKEDSEEDFEDKEMDNDQSEHADGTNEASTAESELDDKEDDEEASDNENKVNVRKLNGEKENEEKVDSGEVDQTTDEWKEEERGRNVEETEERLNDETTKEKSHERHNENGEDTKMNDNQAVDEGQSLVHEKVDEPSMNEDTPAGSVSDDTMNAPETEKHVEALNDHKEDDTIEETERKEDKDVMHDKMSEEDGAKRIKEECVCPVLACNHLADTGMFIDNTNVTDINDLAEMKAFAKGLAIGFKTKDKDVLMGIIANGMGRSYIPGKQEWNFVTRSKSRRTIQERNMITNAKSLLTQNRITQRSHPKVVFHIPKTDPKIELSNQALKQSRDRVNSKFRPQDGHDSQALKRAEAYLLVKQKMPIPPILNDVLFVLVSGAESDVEVHAPVKDIKSAGAKIVAIGVGKDAKIGKLGSQADEKFMVPPGAGNAIVNAIVVAICKKYLMGKPGPNTTPCPCLTEPSKKASPPNKPMNTEMTKEEYTTGMFHAGLPKVDSSSTTSPQPLSGGTTLPSTSSTPPAKKPLTAMSETKPSGEIVPAPTTPLDTSGVGQPASSLTSDKTPIGNQKVATSSQPATQSMPSIPPNAAVTTQATSPKATSKVVHIKNDKLKPLSKTLSRLGENLNKANSEGELNKGSYAIDTDIHNLLSTIGKLKAQVDSLRNDKEQLGSNDAVWTKQSGTGSGLPSQSKGTQSKTNNESIKETGKNKKTDSSRLLKLRIVDQTANEQKNATILHLKLSDNIKAVKNKSLDKPLDQNHGVGNTATTNTALHDTTLSQLTNSATPSGQTMSIKVPKSPAHIQNEKISTKAKQNKNTANVEGVTQNVNDKRPQQINSLSPVNGAQQNVQTTVSGIDVKTSQSTATGATVKQPANALDNVKQTTSPATTSQPKTSLQDANPTKQKPQTITPPQQNVSTTQVTSPSTTTQLTSPSTTTQVTSPPTTTQLTSPSATTQVTSPSTTTQVTSPQTNTPPQESVNTSQKPLPSVTQSDGKSDGKIDQAKSPQSDGKIDQAKSPQSNTIVQPLQQNIVPHKFANTLESIVKPQKPLPSPYPTTHAKANAGGSSLVQTAAQSKTKDFNAIESTLANIVKTQQATPKSTIPACNINLGFVLDGSASVEGTRRGNFLKMINFVKDMIHAFVELSQQVHVGTLVYSTNSSVILSFGTKGTEKVIDQILDSIHYPGQGSLTGKAIKDAWNLMFSSVPRGRKSKLLLLTDGPSNDDVKMPSKWVRDNGVEMFVIGLGQGYDSGELQDMASLPSDKHIITKDYDDLRTSVQEVRNKVCGFNADQVLRIMTNARFSDGFTEINAFQRTLGHKQCILDMVFLLDGSRQVETNGEGNFQREISFVKKAAKYLPLSRNDVHIGVGLLGDPNVMVFPMNEHYTQKSIDFELDHIRYPASSDIQSLEIKYARRLMLTKGIRDVAPRVFVLVTDVSSIDSYREAIDELRTDGSDVAMFGVGSDAYKQEVKVRSTVQGLVDQVVTLDSEDESEAAKHFAINMCKISNAKRTEIPRLNWKASDKIINQN